MSMTFWLFNRKKNKKTIVDEQDVPQKNEIEKTNRKNPFISSLIRGVRASFRSNRWKYFVNNKDVLTTDGKVARSSNTKLHSNRFSKVNQSAIDEESEHTNQVLRDVKEVEEKENEEEEEEEEEEESLTQIVIAQIEHDTSVRNLNQSKKMDSAKDGNNDNDQHQHQGSLDNEKDMIEGEHSELINQPNDSIALRSQSVKSLNEIDLKKKVKVEAKLSASPPPVPKQSISIIQHQVSYQDEEPIYDVPPSKSLINLNTNSYSNDDSDQLQLQAVQHHIQVNKELGYYHTSSPNLLFSVSNQKTESPKAEEEIYDTPITRSVAV